MILTGRSLFSLGVAVITLVLIILSLDYNEKARLIPLVVGILLFVLSALQFLGDAFPQLGKYLPFVHQKGVLTPNKEMTDKAEESNQNEVQESWAKIYQVLLLLAGFLALMHYTDYLIAIPIFLFLSVWLISKARIAAALWVVVITELFMYILFELILQVRL